MRNSNDNQTATIEVVTQEWTNKEIVNLAEHIAWPVTILLIILRFVFAFRDTLKTLLSRTTEFEAGGVKTKFNPQEQQRASLENEYSKTETPTSKVVEQIKKYQAQNTSALSEYILENVQNVRQSIGSDQEYIDVLEKSTSISSALNSCLITAQYIFKSQVALLKSIFIAGETGYGKAGAMFIYNEAKKKFPEVYKDYDFASYMDYLVSNKLVELDGDVYRLDIVGKAFIDYLNKAPGAENLITNA